MDYFTTREVSLAGNLLIILGLATSRVSFDGVTVVVGAAARRLSRPRATFEERRIMAPV